jgi:hypothetical protein
MDSLISTLVTGALLAGKAVLAIKDGADPNGNAGLVFSAAAGAAPVLRARLEAHLTTLASYGVELVREAEFLVMLERRLLTGAAVKSAAQPVALPTNGMIEAPFSQVEMHHNGTKANVVTAAEILALQPGSILRLAPGSRLTPQAQDTARRMSLHLEYE